MSTQATPTVERPAVLYMSVGIIAVCGIIYELIIGAASSYMLGDSVLQFSVTIGLFMSALGIGSWLSQLFKRHLFAVFLTAELLIGLVGGASALLLFWGYAMAPEFYPVLQYGLTLTIGALVGLEIPILMRLLEGRHELRYNAAYVLSLDYIGGLVGSLAFPLLLLPYLGLIRAALLVGLLNTLVVVIGLWRYAPHFLRSRAAFGGATVLALLALVAGFAQAKPMEAYFEQRLYRDRIVATEQTAYQHLTLTQESGDLRLFINGNLQYSSLDEYRYHEALIHVPIARMGAVPQRVLLLGAGDGLAARELLKYPQVRHVDLVDLDPAMIRLHQTRAELVALNAGSLLDERVRIHTVDALKYLEATHDRYDLIVMDLPDPNNESLIKLYTREFYAMAARKLRGAGAMVIQASSPYFARQAYWCIAKTVASAGLATQHYHLDVPSFGDWGFVIGSPRVLPNPPFADTVPTRYLKAELAPGLFRFGRDEDESAAKGVEVNTLFNPVLLRYYQSGWGRDR